MAQLIETYRVKTTHSAFYTGGDVVWTEDGEMLLFQCGSKIKAVDVNQGQVISTIGEEENNDDVDEDTILTFSLSKDNNVLIVAHRSSLIKMWLWKDSKLVNVWRSLHKVPISRLAITSDCSLLATAATDSSIRLWDLNHHTCIHNLNVSGMQGVVSVLKVQETDKSNLLFGAADDAAIKCWDLKTGALIKTYNGHFSKVTDLQMFKDHKHMISCSRDKVFIVWDIVSGISLRTVPVFESLESLTLVCSSISLPNSSKPFTGGTYVITGGEKGVLKVFDALKGNELFTEKESILSCLNNEGSAIINLLYSESKNKLAVISSDHTVFIRDINNNLNLDKQFEGFNDEIIEVVLLGENNSHMAVATNSPIIKLYTASNMNCQFLKGHNDIVISLAVSTTNKSLLVSGAKDNSIRVWKLDKNGSAHCVANGTRHTASVSALTLGRRNSNLLISGSHDTTIKLWILPKKFTIGNVKALNVKYTEIAHDKDINSICLAPNDKILATGSLDKTAKVWNADNLSLIGVLRGHTRSIWCVKFSPVDQIVLTASADTSIKLWSISDLSCIKTFEGHDSSVLCATFLTKGLQVISGGGDGLVKLWCVKTGECLATFDHHDGKVWALVVNDNESELITGGDDSKLIIWKDCTEETKIEAINKRQEYVIQEQELSNLIHNKKLLPALKLALNLNRPATALKIINSVQQENKLGLEKAIKKLDVAQKESLLKCANMWNSNTKTAQAAQTVISLLLEDITNGSVSVDTSTLESLSVFTERHFKRMTQLQQDLKVLLYTCDIMQPQVEFK